MREERRCWEDTVLGPTAGKWGNRRPCTPLFCCPLPVSELRIFKPVLCCSSAVNALLISSRSSSPVEVVGEDTTLLSMARLPVLHLAHLGEVQGRAAAPAVVHPHSPALKAGRGGLFQQLQLLKQKRCPGWELSRGRIKEEGLTRKQSKKRGMKQNVWWRS
jgi:hypothetical protein